MKKIIIYSTVMAAMLGLAACGGHTIEETKIGNQDTIPV